MSTVTNRLTSISGKLRQRLEVMALGGIDNRDKSLFIDALVMRIALLFDLSTGSTQMAKAINAFIRTLLGLKAIEVEEYANDWKTCREILTSLEFRCHLDDDPESRRTLFKRAAQGRIHYKWITNVVLALVGLEDNDWYAKTNQFVVFDVKLNFSSLDLSQSECSRYLDFENDWQGRMEWYRCLHDVEETPEDTTMLYLARRSAEDMFGSFLITNYPFRPRHGNGATVEVKRSEADAWHKNRHFKVDSEIITYLKYRVPGDDWHDWFYVPYRGLDRTAEIACVPKSMTRNRTISKEPTTLQYLQQDLFQALDDYFKDELADRIDLHDQTRSRILAQVGSSDGSYATVDLSAASDSVSCSLVSYLFDGMPLLYPLLATRSNFVRVRDKAKTIDQCIQIEKFAPMGSAVCFPLECAVFAIMCETAVRAVKGRASRSGDYVVYGDDIVIRSEYYRYLIRTLEFFGFEVNRDKSFGGEDEIAKVCGLPSPALFREACGIECLDGVDITPLRLSRRLVSVTDNDSDRLAGEGVGLIDLVNRAYLYHYAELRKWLVSQLRRHWWFRSCLYVSYSDYREFSYSVMRGEASWVRLAVPFVITDDACDTQWRAFRSRSGTLSPLHTYEALVTVATARRGLLPIYASHPAAPRRRGESVHDENDYFTWTLAQVASPVDEDEFILDDTGLVTIRSRDLKWSRKWVTLSRRARLAPRIVNEE